MSMSGGSTGPQQVLSAIIGVLALLLLLGMAGFMLLNALAPERAREFLPRQEISEPTRRPLPAMWTPGATQTRTAETAAIRTPTSTASPTATETPRVPSGTAGPAGQIAFISSRSGSGDIYVMQADGSDQSRLFLDQLRQDRPRISPSGRLIAFESRPAGGSQPGAEVRVTDLDATLGFLLDDAARHASWSPDGERLVLVRGTQIVLVNADGGAGVALFDDPIGGPHLSVWSPDGDEIAYVRDEGDAVGIYLARVQDGASSLVAVMPQFVEITDLEWSPDGGRFLFCAVDRDAQVGIYTILYGGTGLEILLPDACDPSWSPDGTHFAFSADWDGLQNIYLALADGTVLDQLTRNQGQNYAPDWGGQPVVP